MYLEDYIGELAKQSFNLNLGQIEFLSSLYEQVQLGRELTTRQGHAACAVMREIMAEPDFKIRFPTVDESALRTAVDERRWKTPLRVAVTKRREARYLGDNIVALSYQPNPEIRNAAKPLHAVWKDQLYLVTVTRSRLDCLIHFLGKFGFEIDKSLEEYLALCLGSKKQISHVIAVEDGAVINVCDDDIFANFIMNVCGGERI